MLVERQEAEKTVQSGDSSRIAAIRYLPFFGSGQKLVNNFKIYIVEIIYIFIVDETQKKLDVGLIGHNTVF